MEVCIRRSKIEKYTAVYVLFILLPTLAVADSGSQPPAGVTPSRPVEDPREAEAAWN